LQLFEMQRIVLKWGEPKGNPGDRARQEPCPRDLGHLEGR